MKTKNKFKATDKTKKLTIAKIEGKLERKLDGYKMDIFWLLTELSQFNDLCLQIYLLMKNIYSILGNFVMLRRKTFILLIFCEFVETFVAKCI